MKMSEWFKSEIRLHGDIIECNDFAYAEMSCEYIVDDIDAGVAICYAVNNHDRMADEIAELRDKHSKMSNEIAELCEALGAVNEIALLIASDIYEDSLLHDNVKLLMDIHK